MSDEKIHDKMKSLREKTGYTQEQVAKFLHLQRSSYTKIERGQTQPSVSVLVKLAQLYTVDPAIFLQSELSAPTPHASDNNTKRKPTKTPDNSSHIYDLNKDEKMLIGYFRMMSKEEQQDFIKSLEDAYKKS